MIRPILFIAFVFASAANAQSTDDHEAELLRVRRALELATEQAKLLHKQDEIARLTGQSQPGPTPTGPQSTGPQLPTLVRILHIKRGAASQSIAEFQLGGGTLKARVGDTVAQHWTVVSIEEDAVILSDDEGRRVEAPLGTPATPAAAPKSPAPPALPVLEDPTSTK